MLGFLEIDMTFKVYLAGPIGGLTYDDAQDWRTLTNGFIKHHSDGKIVCYSPLRYKRHIVSDGPLPAGPLDTHPMTTADGITCRDLYDCKTADLILVNFLGAKTVSIGTVLELGYAKAHDKPVIAVMEDEGNPHENHSMLQKMWQFRFNNLESARSMVLDFLLP